MIFALIFWISIISIAQDNITCGSYVPGQHIEYGTTAKVSGFLRKNKMFEGIDFGPQSEWASISYVLVTDEPLWVQQGEVNNPMSCQIQEFTLHLTQEQVEKIKVLSRRRQMVTVEGVVRMAESSAEEYDNGVIVDLKIIE